MSTIFEQILNKSIPCDFIYEDDYCVAFNDIEPQAPVHCLLIPKQKLVNLKDANSDNEHVLGKLMSAIPKVTDIICPGQDFRIVVNNGANASQTVFYLHIHILSGRKFNWPPG